MAADDSIPSPVFCFYFPTDIQNNSGYTALIWASYWGRLEATTLLIEAKASLDMQNTHGYSALMWAAINGHTTTAKSLIENKASLGIVNKVSPPSLA